jgi:hypothetical protein
MYNKTFNYSDLTSMSHHFRMAIDVYKNSIKVIEGCEYTNPDAKRGLVGTFQQQIEECEELSTLFQNAENMDLNEIWEEGDSLE